MADRDLSEDEVADLKEAFAMFDINGDGTGFLLFFFRLFCTVGIFDGWRRGRRRPASITLNGCGIMEGLRDSSVLLWA